MSADPCDDFSWHGYERTWKSDAIWVDLRPIRKRIERIQRHRPGRVEKSRVYNTVGEVAAAVLLGGSVETLDKKKPDIRLASGDEYEVRTSFWGGGKKYSPAMVSGRRAGPHLAHQKKLPTIWCVTRRFPDCYDGAWVCGVIQPERFRRTRLQGGGKLAWAWVNAWADDGRFTHVAEIMADELLRPVLPVGMFWRRHAEDQGIPEYVDDYGFFRPAQTSASTPNASISQSPGSGRATQSG